MNASEIRLKWIQFFESKRHVIEPSASLVPHNDPSLFWINAGMAPLKLYFDGRAQPAHPRIANIQKCIRTNDIENVGKTRRHHTFFEMLGNFSIGDYFKKEAISWAWEFLTSSKWLALDEKRLSVTVYPEDEQAFMLWHEHIGLAKERIIKLQENFWDIGEGPCGPCTEIFYDRGEEYDGDTPVSERYPGGDNERYLEVWNLVFSQFNHNQDGSYTPLPNKNIDTGAGLERLSCILQQVDSNFDTDLFQPIIRKISCMVPTKVQLSLKNDVAFKVIADHIRTIVMAVGDGVLPSNEGRGYIIRRLLRRAVRYGQVLGFDRPCLYELTDVVSELMGSTYAEVANKKMFIAQVIQNEEKRFYETLTEGLDILAAMTTTLIEKGHKVLSGEQAFKLYDTYGFPIDLTEDYAREKGVFVDRAQFDQHMEQQRDRARSARVHTDSMQIQSDVWTKVAKKSQFVGYGQACVETTVVAIVVEDQLVDVVEQDQPCQVLLSDTPFYVESGGQVSDQGHLHCAGMKACVNRMMKSPLGQPIHQITLETGKLKVGDIVIAQVDMRMRRQIENNHSATHLLHKALKEIVGEHVNQAGSFVGPDRLRFDFSHLCALSHEQLMEVERRVNENIWSALPVKVELHGVNEAKALGATALFGEKYGEIVRVVRIGEYSLELCGGCHVKNTSHIGMFKLLSETGIGSGVRRIEAVTGQAAYMYMDSQLSLLLESASLLKCATIDVPKRIEMLHQHTKQTAKLVESLQTKLSGIQASQLLNEVVQVGKTPLLAVRVAANSMDSLRTLADELKSKLPQAVIALGAPLDNKVNFVVVVPKVYNHQGLHAGNIVKQMSALCGGGGGGRPDMAQAGAKDVSKLDQALELLHTILHQKDSDNDIKH